MAPWPLPFWIAHRGAGKLAPENTLAAFRLGASYGYRAFECDVKLSADGTPFLLHDATLERTTRGRGVAGEQPWAALSQLDAGSWHSSAFAGEPLPALATVAQYVQQQGCALNLEIKPTPGTEAETGRAVGAACQALWQGVTTPLAIDQREIARSVGNVSPAYAAECQLPASSLASSAQVRASARPRPSVVRSSVASCSRNATPSPDSLTSNSTIR